MGDKIKLKDACKILNGFAFKSGKYVDSGIRIIRIANVQKGYVEDENPAFYSKSEEPSIRDYSLKENDLLLSLTGNVGRVALLDKKWLPAALNQRVACLRIKDNRVIKDYLYFALLSDKFENDCIKSSNGIAQKNMSTEWLKDYEVPLPSKQRQQEITSSLKQLSVIIKNKTEQIQQLDELIKARFVEMFGDGFETTELRNICRVTSGGTPSTKNSDYYNGTIPWVTTTALGPNYIDGTKAKAYISEEAVANSATKIIPSGNILFGIRVGVGKTSINDVDICTNQDIVAILDIDEKKFSKLFIKHVLDANRAHYDSLKKGATILGITSDDLKNTPIPLVPIKAQKDFEVFVTQVDKSKFAVQKSLEKTQLLFDSLMQEYFG